MYKVKRLLISPYIGRGCRLILIACLINLGLWLAVVWRSLGSTPGILPPVAERQLGYLRRSRHLAQYMDEDSSPLISPQIGGCTSLEIVPIVVLVSSAPGNVEQRDAIRATWGSVTPTYFFMGRAGTERINLDEQMVENYMEAKQHGDIVVGDYLDSYENLTLKTSQMLQWSLRSCPQAEFIMKTDDDVLVNPWTLRQLLAEHVSHKLVGYKRNSSTPHRDRENKWYLPRWLYRADLIPEYLSGTGYLIRGDHVRNIYEAAYKVPLINLEDVYLTYLVAKQKLGLPLTHEPRLSPYKPLVLSGCAYWRLASAHSLKPRQMLKIWYKICVLAEQYEQNGVDPCSVIDIFFGFLSWEMLLV